MLYMREINSPEWASATSESKARTLVDKRLLAERGVSDTPDTASEEWASAVGAASLDDDEEMARVARMIDELDGIFIVIDDQQYIAMILVLWLRSMSVCNEWSRQETVEVGGREVVRFLPQMGGFLYLSERGYRTMSERVDACGQPSLATPMIVRPVGKQFRRR
jgi:hypothetical protein